jgi:hypothetical protein
VLSEHQYYEFQAVDRTLIDKDISDLRTFSSRAQITARSFINTYEWGDFRGDPTKFMERWFDLHLYLANWGTRVLMIRVPKHLVDQQRIEALIGDTDWVSLKEAGEHLIIDIVYEADDGGDYGWNDRDDEGWLPVLAALREDLLAGDLRLFYLLWLAEVEGGTVPPETIEPLPGIGPLTPALETFADFFNIDPNLVGAAAEALDGAPKPPPLAPDEQLASAGLSDEEKTGFLIRVFEGDPRVANELRLMVRNRSKPTSPDRTGVLRTAGQLLNRTIAVGIERAQAEAEKLAAQEQRRIAQARMAQRARLIGIAAEGEKIWRELETEIERRNASGYEKAVALLVDLAALADQRGTSPEFDARLDAIKQRHSGKSRFIQRLSVLAQGDDGDAAG